MRDIVRELPIERKCFKCGAKAGDLCITKSGKRTRELHSIRLQYPDCSRHADTDAEAPRGYIQKAGWADEKAKTHNQHQCPGCGLWKLWEPKIRRGAR